jgi:hypothetical protein
MIDIDNYFVRELKYTSLFWQNDCNLDNNIKTNQMTITTYDYCNVIIAQSYPTENKKK